MKIPPGKVRNLPSAEGRIAGAKISALCDDAERSKIIARPRCTTCAFRLGTIPNACLATVMDALKCAVEGRPFLCHEKPGFLCAGYVVMRQRQSFTAPWPFSTEDKTDGPTN